VRGEAVGAENPRVNGKDYHCTVEQVASWIAGGQMNSAMVWYFAEFRLREDAPLVVESEVVSL
jgi:hypothetical protein